MPAYIVCPHCEHPTVLPAAEPDRRYCCRQCNGYYVLRSQAQEKTTNGSSSSAGGTATSQD